MNKKYGNDVTLYNVKDIQRIFKCKEKKAYQILHSRNLPTMRIGRSVYVTHENLAKYIEQNSKSVIKV